MTHGATFDLAGLAGEIDRARAANGISWGGLSRQVRVSASTIRRCAVATDAEADGVLALVRWLGVAPEVFVEGSSVAGQPLEPPDGGMIRVDMEAFAAVAGNPPRPGARARTTIQRLAAAADQAGRPIASLTRWSETCGALSLG